ncbi:MAG: hypothetical protein KKD01_12910 [Proteobacteria bacterium]|nr:hypothetical protein [Pseudomonadota bacterium]
MQPDNLVHRPAHISEASLARWICLLAAALCGTGKRDDLFHDDRPAIFIDVLL